MPVNKNALIRYKTIDACLQNRFRKWTLDDLTNACAQALDEFEGIKKGISQRTIQADIQMMRSEKLGYNAPIVLVDKKFYTYEDKSYSITKIPLTNRDLNTLTEITQILQQFKGFQHFQTLEAMVSRLQQQIFKTQSQQNVVIDLEKNENLVGLEYINALYQAVVKKQVLTITYQGFKANQSQIIVFSPHLLKEYRNRWFVLGMRAGNPYPHTLALDRIKQIVIQPEHLFVENATLNASYFVDMIGVSKNMHQSPKTITFWVNCDHAPYIRTKPFHCSQQIQADLGQLGCIFRIEVIVNYELERELLGFGDALEVLSPESLRTKIANRILNAAQFYKKKDE
jgi:predicted DNA-binding transcriptional regulator YafY